MTVLKSRLPRAGLAMAAGLALGLPASADQVINDDLIVRGSACIGFDCVNGENFGFDTLRLKENNLRIHANDTSNSASFPTVDWRLVFNESSNGGANKFSIDSVDNGSTPFTIEYGAPSHSLYVDDGGRIGLGTNTPVVDLHVKSGNTPTLRLEQDGSSGFTPQTWDVAGNETNFFIRDATSGSTLPFRLYPGAPSNALTIEGTTGDIGIGTTTPDASLHVIGSVLIDEDGDGGAGDPDTVLQTRGDGTQLIYFDSTDGGAVQMRFRTDSENRRFLATDNAGTIKSQFVFLDNSVEIAGANDTAELWATIDTGGIRLPAGSAFSVDGTNLAVPDYVFADGYELMPLSDLSAFIDKNSHLPNVPSASEVKANGLDLTQMQLSLLQKVEELTLYTLAQQETIETLEARIEALTAR